MAHKSLRKSIVLLSGGLDSTSIICQMAELLGEARNDPLRSFSYVDESYDELDQIEATVDATRAESHILNSDDSAFLERLEEVLWFQDEPIHSLNALVGFELYRMAAGTGVKVILNGQGADETWAGYGSYFLNFRYGLARTGRMSRLLHEIREYAVAHKARPGPLLWAVMRTLFRNQLRRSLTYRKLAMRRARHAVAKDSWFTQELFDVYPNDVPEFEELDLHTALARSVAKDPLPLFLRIEDRNSMANSIETRLPFLDYRLVELAFRTQPDWKIRGKWNKFALRQAMKTTLPDLVQSRIDKMGFPVSSDKWFSGPLYEPLREVLAQRNSEAAELLNVPAIMADLEKHKAGYADFSRRFLRVMQVQLLALGEPMRARLRAGAHPVRQTGSL